MMLEGLILMHVAPPTTYCMENGGEIRLSERQLKQVWNRARGKPSVHTPDVRWIPSF